METAKQRCSERLFKGYHSYQCDRTAKVERDGKGYCGIHDPVRIKEKQAKQFAKWDAESEARKKAWRWEKAAAAFCAQVSAEELERLVRIGRPLHIMLEEEKL